MIKSTVPQAESPHVLFLPSFYSDPEKPVCGVFFTDQANALRKSSVKVAVAYVEPRRLRSLAWGRIRENHFQVTFGNEDGLPTLRLRGWNTLLNCRQGGLIWSFLSRRLVDAYIARFGRPDLIHAHNALWAGHVAANIQYKYGIPYVLTEHSTDFPMNNVSKSVTPYLRRVFDGAGSVVCVSDGLAESVRPFCTRKEIEIVPNVVHSDYFDLPVARASVSPFVFLSIAHLVERKGGHILIEAFADAFKNNDNVRLEIGGDGPQRPVLEQRCRELKIEHKVTFLGALSREQVRAAMWRAHAFVLASFFETFGVVFIEAMSTGLPVIGTICGGPEYIITPETGLLVQPGDSVALGGALQSVVANTHYDPDRIRKDAVLRFSEQSFSRSIKKIYKRILESRQFSRNCTRC